MTHPLQTLPPETFKWLLRWSRILFWIVLGIYAYIKYASMPGKSTTDTIINTPVECMGALGFWAGYDYLFMLAYTLFFAVCCVWGAEQLRAKPFFHQLGIALAWAMLLQLLIDMAENWCIWQIALAPPDADLQRMFRVLAIAKIPLFAGAAAYALATSIWRRFLR